MAGVIPICFGTLWTPLNPALVTWQDDVVNIFLNAVELGMVSPVYTWLATDATATNPTLTSSILRNFHGMLGLAPSVQSGKLNEEFHAFDDRYGARLNALL
jgi:hypothetical protein